MAINWPTSLDSNAAGSFPAIGAATQENASGYEHHVMHSNVNEAVLALEAKVGIGASPASAAAARYGLMADGTGTTTWRALVEADISDLGSYALGSHTHALNDLSDVDTTGVDVDYIIKWSGTAWVVAAQTGGGFDPAAVGESIVPDTDSAYNIGSTTNQWAKVYTDVIRSETGSLAIETAGGSITINADLDPAITNTIALGSSSKAYTGVVVSVGYAATGDLALLPGNALTYQVVLDATAGDHTVSGDWLPSAASTYDLGDATNIWRNLYVNEVRTDSIETRGGSQILLDFGSGTYRLTHSGGLNYFQSGDGTQTTDSWYPIVFGRYSSGTVYWKIDASLLTATADIVPATDSAWDLGSSANKWAELFVDNITLQSGGVIRSDGSVVYYQDHIYPSSDATYNLGASTSRWGSVYAQNVYAYTSADVYSKIEPGYIRAHGNRTSSYGPAFYLHHGDIANDPQWVIQHRGALDATYVDDLVFYRYDGSTFIWSLTLGSGHAGNPNRSWRDFLPSSNGALDLGSSTKYWEELYINQVILGDDATLKNTTYPTSNFFKPYHAGADTWSTTNSGYVASISNFGVLIDSNNNSTTEKFWVGHNSNGVGAASPIFYVEESGNVGIYGSTVAVNNGSSGTSGYPWGGVYTQGPVYYTAAAATNRYHYFQSSGSTRWQFGIDNSAESGSDAGSNFYISAYTDAGSWRAHVIGLNRAASTITAYGDLIPNGTRGLGTTSSRWNHLYANGATIYGNILPDTDSSRDLGSSTGPKYWANAYIDNIVINSISQGRGVLDVERETSTATSSVSSETDVTNLVTSSISVLSGRRYRLHWSLMANASSTAGVFVVRLYRTVSAVNTLIEQWNFIVPAITRNHRYTGEAYYDATGTAAHTFKLTIEKTGGGTVSTIVNANYPSIIVVEDVGDTTT